MKSILSFVATLALITGLSWSLPSPARAAAPLLAVTPIIDPASSAYLHSLAEQMDILTKSLQDLGRLFTSPRIGNETWSFQVLVNLVAIQLAHEEIVALEPPANFAVAHAALIDATSQCNDATYNVTNGLDNFDVDLLELAAKQITSCGEDMRNISGMFTEAAIGAAPPPTSTPIATPTKTQTPANTPVATPIAPASADTVIVSRDANLRAGPGTNHKVIGSAKAGQQLKVVGRNPAGDWLQLDNKAWIAAFLVKPAASATTLTPTPTHTPTPSPTPT